VKTLEFCDFLQEVFQNYNFYASDGYVEILNKESSFCKLLPCLSHAVSVAYDVSKKKLIYRVSKKKSCLVSGGRKPKHFDDSFWKSF